MKKPLIVLTGAAGFIGCNILRQLNAQGAHNVLLVDELGCDDKWKNLVGLRFFDIIHKDALFSFLQGRQDEIEAFIHLGACSSTTEKDADYLLQNNYRYTVRLAEYALNYNKRFIYASSAATYGNGLLGFCDDHSLLETLKPLNMYGYSKHLFDLWAKQQGVLDRIVGLKYFNVFGPYERHKGSMASVIVRMVPQALQEGRILLFKSNDPKNFGDGEQKRDFIYVKDAAVMTCQFLQMSISGIFNIGSGVAASWNDLARAVIQALQLPIEIQYIDMPTHLSKQYQNYTCADMSKYTQAMGNALHQSTSLCSAVQDYVCHYLLKE